jgi:hypothetical protein
MQKSIHLNGPHRSCRELHVLEGVDLRWKKTTAINDPADTMEYELSFDLDLYSSGWMIIFYFLICLSTMVFVSYKFVVFGFKIIKILMSHRSW